jgi:hypothetical protein
MPPDLAQNLEELLDRSVRSRLKDLGDELAGSLRDEYATLLTSAAEGAKESARAEAASASGATLDSLAESARRIRGAQAVTEIAAALVEAAAGYCGRAALFIHRGDRALGFRIAGNVDEHTQMEFQKVSVALPEAPALEQVMRTLQPQENRGDEGQLGSAVVGLLGLTHDDAVRLIPVSLRDKALAVLYLDSKAPEGAMRSVETSAIEVLVSLTEAWIEAVGNRKKLQAA